jgi:hypothetical protein
MHALRVLLDCPFAGLHTGETHFMQEILLCSCICCASKLAIGERCLYRLKGCVCRLWNLSLVAQHTFH